MDLNLKGKVALVTGAASQAGFGKAICLRLAREGCQIAAADVNLEGATQTAAEIEKLGVAGLAVRADITRKGEVQAMVKQVLAKFGRIDILVNNAGGVSHGGNFLEQDETLWDKEVALNLKGTMLVCQAVLPSMLEKKYGKIVNVSSSSARIVHPGVAMYTIAKGAVYIFTRQLAKTYVAQGVNCNSVAPGWSLDTDFVKGGQAAKERMKPMFLAETPIGRGTSVEDIANMVAFLASDVSADIVGQVISVDGGSTFS
jgi:NAD(P)-dependent dehydrogenase (short-subunit alcohol dehydrogenase family)